MWSIFKSVVVVVGGCVAGILVSFLALSVLLRHITNGDHPGYGFGIVLIVGIGAIAGAALATMLSARVDKERISRSG